MAEPTANESRIAAILDRYFDLTESGADVDIDQLCGGDAALAARFRRTLAHAPTFAKPAPAAPPAEAWPETVGRFRLVAPIGRGAMGRVFVARDSSPDRTVAIKLMSAAALAMPSAPERFEREARIMETLAHPNIAPVYASGREGEHAYIAMRLLSGPSLDALEAPPGPRRTAEIGRAAALALDYAHRAGIVHRDVKPANIILDDGVPFVVDFGLARAATDTALTRSGQVPGTLAYLAPETLRDGAVPDPRSDVYALGATLYEIVAGRRAFPATEEGALIASILAIEPAPLNLPPADRDLETIILRALEKDPARRFPSAAALADELARYLDGRTIATRRKNALDRLALRVRRHPRAAAIVGVAGLAAILALGKTVLDRNERESAFQRMATSAHAAIEHRELQTADQLINGFAPIHRTDARWIALRAECDAILALEDLIDFINDRFESQRSTILAEKIARLQATRAADYAPRTAALAEAVAEMHRGKFDVAAAIAADLDRRDGPGRASAVIAAAARRETPDLKSLPAAKDIDEYLFSALALRAGDFAIDLRNAEIDAALRMDPANYRAQLAHANALISERRYPEAREAFRSLRRSNRHQPMLDRIDAWIAMIEGRLEDSEKGLAAVPESARTPCDDVIRINIAVRRGDPAKIDAAISAGLGRWPDDPEMLYLRGQHEAKFGSKDAALKTLAAARKASMRPALTNEIAASIAAIRTFQLVGSNTLGPRPPKDADEREDASEMIDELNALIPLVREPATRAKAQWLTSVLLRSLGRDADASKALDDAVATAPEVVQPHLEQAAHALMRLGVLGAGAAAKFDAPVSKELRESLDEWQTFLRRTYSKSAVGVVAASEAQVKFAEQLAAFVARLRGDRGECKEAASRFLSHATKKDQTADLVQALLRWAEDG